MDRAGSAEQAVAIDAIDRLVEMPDAVLPLVQQHVKPVPAPELAQLLDDLDSDSFVKRSMAMKELASLEFAAAKTLRAALQNQPNLELRQRVEILLKKLQEPITSPQLLASWRAVTILEQLDTPAAREYLKVLAGGGAGGTPDAGSKGGAAASGYARPAVAHIGFRPSRLRPKRQSAAERRVSKDKADSS